MIKVLWNNRKMLWELAVNDCRARFSSSMLGVVWTVLQPLVNMLVIWLVFQVGFRSTPIAADVPFIVWYMPAFVAWNYFQESTSQVSGSMIEYSYLVKKVNFSVEIIPPIKILSNAIIHTFFIGFVIIVNLVYGRLPSIYYIQVLYYFICVMALSMSIGWITSSVAPFVPDITNIVALIIQTGFWITPIFWDASNMSGIIGEVLKVNPMYYICEGYRNCFVYKKFFWEQPGMTIYFWSIVMICWILGCNLYSKSKKHFDDVL